VTSSWSFILQLSETHVSLISKDHSTLAVEVQVESQEIARKFCGEQTGIGTGSLSLPFHLYPKPCLSALCCAMDTVRILLQA